MHPNLSVLLLAGGSGRRLAGLTGGVPKQFWAMDADGRSLIEATALRTARLVPADRRITVLDRRHRPYLKTLRAPELLGQVVYQPEDRGTAVGVLLGLTEVLSLDPDALVLMTPSDHGIAREDQFRQGIRRALLRLGGSSSGVVLFGSEPTTADVDYGWITPAASVPSVVGQCVPIADFSEKPAPDAAARLYVRGAVWNTMVLVARGRALLGLFWRYLPELAVVFASAQRLPPSRRQAFLEAEYESLPAADFSRDLIGRSTGLELYTWPAAMGWSDLGTPDRVRQWRRSPLPARTPVASHVA